MKVQTKTFWFSHFADEVFIRFVRLLLPLVPLRQAENLCHKGK